MACAVGERGYHSTKTAAAFLRSTAMERSMQPAVFETLPLPPGIRSRLVPNIHGLPMHLLEAGFESQDRPCVLLLHGFPELAYSWRKVMLPLAAVGFHVIAP